MKHKAALLAAILVWVTAPVATAEESGANKPVKKASHIEEKADTPAEGYKLDYEELFGCKPMGEDGHVLMHEPASGASRQGTMQPTQEHDHMQERH
ncbi:MAG: hypothetical protein PHG89_06290 [Gallionella sp.]|nr:hypothetical protein [Gallionella sp.]